MYEVWAFKLSPENNAIKEINTVSFLFEMNGMVSVFIMNVLFSFYKGILKVVYSKIMNYERCNWIAEWEFFEVKPIKYS